MRGEIIGVWSETWREIWLPLIDHEGVSEDVFCELYRALAPALKNKPTVEALADIIDNRTQSRMAFERTVAGELAGERALVAFVGATYSTLDELSGDDLSNRYFNLLAAFIDKFSLRYDLRRPCTLCPTLPGVFASLVRDLRVQTGQDGHLGVQMKEFENAGPDLRHDCSDGRIKTCIQKQVNLLEAIGRTVPGITGTTLGAICNQIGTWPHDKLKEAMKNLYGFASDYPGIRHGGALPMRCAPWTCAIWSLYPARRVHAVLEQRSRRRHRVSRSVKECLCTAQFVCRSQAMQSHDCPSV